MAEWKSSAAQPDEDALKVLLGMYAAERSDSAAMMNSGFAQVVALMAYLGVVTTLIGKNEVDAPIILTALPIPALLLLLTYTIHGYNQGLRATSGRTLERLLYPALSAYVPAHHPDGGKPELDPRHFREGKGVDLRHVALGLHSTELLYNTDRANKWHSWFLKGYYVLAAAVVFGFSSAVVGLGIDGVWNEDATSTWTGLDRTVYVLEFILIGFLLAMFSIIAFRAGPKHRERAERAADAVVEAAGRRSSRPMK
ncbi:hypothetical protein IU459_33900 [Nocardia amamiensis]|uniref:Uncharacterized protein n=1 Tax=Nocardia amamiensis TaxID=404578 RepID=A0ABS0D0W7_9NOCA|nr:hypothetical protein [Nocardia amamiensis]MBF6302497.1 hypothetical protein [Nocardia amamiensis]